MVLCVMWSVENLCSDLNQRVILNSHPRRCIPNNPLVNRKKPPKVKVDQNQYFQCHVTQPLLLEQLREFEVDISSGQISRIFSLIITVRRMSQKIKVMLELPLTILCVLPDHHCYSQSLCSLDQTITGPLWK